MLSTLFGDMQRGKSSIRNTSLIYTVYDIGLTFREIASDSA